MMGLGKKRRGTLLKWQLLISILDFWGVILKLQHMSKHSSICNDQSIPPILIREIPKIDSQEFSSYSHENCHFKKLNKIIKPLNHNSYNNIANRFSNVNFK